MSDSVTDVAQANTNTRPIEHVCLQTLAAARVLDDPAGYILQEPFCRPWGARAGVTALPQALQLPDPAVATVVNVFTINDRSLYQISGRCRFSFRMNLLIRGRLC